jgi:hypothetical protein
VDAEVLIQQMPPADVVGALRTLVRRTPWPMELPVVNVLALVVTDVRARAATESSPGTRLFRGVALLFE